MDTWGTVLRKEAYTDQIHRRFSTDQVRNLFRGYTEGLIDRSTIEETLGINRSRFFALLSVYRRNPEAFSITYHRGTPRKVFPYRFQKARKAGRTLFRPFLLPKPYRSTKDVFCLKETRVVNPYRRLSFYQEEIPLRHVPPREEVDIHLIPHIDRETVEIRIWWKQALVQSITYPFKAFPRVHF